MTQTMTTFDKVTLIGPAPFGGTFTTTASDPDLHRMTLRDGYRLYRRWTVVLDGNGVPLGSIERKGQGWRPFKVTPRGAGSPGGASVGEASTLALAVAYLQRMAA
jgi:hypothetical protein